MNCSMIRENIGPYLDGELAPEAARALEDHLLACDACAGELDRFRSLAKQLRDAAAEPVRAPEHVWPAIERRLSAWRGGPGMAKGTGLIRLFRRPLAAAASMALFIGVATAVLVWVNRSAQPAQAAVDYSVLLDGLAADVDGAVSRFLAHYAGREIAPQEASAAAPGLEFNLPLELPGGFKRESVHRLRFGTLDGVAARYRRDGEPLVVFFHPPLARTRMGVHRESQCHVAGREGQRVEVGPWQLLHFTDPTTCHCLLSRVQDEALQSAIFAAIAPRFR